MTVYSTFEQILISPIQELLNSPSGGAEHRAGPVYPDFDSLTFERHCRGARCVDVIPTLSPDEQSQILVGSYIYGGCIINHFGHFVAEFIHRLPFAIKDHPDLKIVFCLRAGETYVPPFINDIFIHFNILDKIVLINKLVTVDRLSVYPQEESLGGRAPSVDYIDLLQSHSIYTSLIEGERKKTAFISRSMQKGRFALESLVDKFFLDFNFDVIFPEKLSIKDQLLTYLNYDKLVFSEGSALHGCQLLGKLNSDLAVISRRGFDFGREFLSSRFNSVTYIKCISQSFGPLTFQLKPADWMNFVILDYEVLFLSLADFLGIDRNFAVQWIDLNKEKTRELFFDDIKNYLSSHVNYKLYRFDASVNHMRDAIDTLDLLSDAQKAELKQIFILD